MWDVIWGYGGDIIRIIGRLDRTQWVLVFVAVMVVGFFCMRGFGSRNNY